MSTEIKCLVCGRTYSEEEPVCPTCKFPNISMTSDDPAEREKILNMAAEYKKAHWNFPLHYTVNLLVYTYEPLLGEKVNVPEEMDTWTDIRQAGSELIPIGDTEMLQDGIISWYPETFARQSEDITLRIRMLPKTEGKVKNFAVHMDNPKTEDFWRVGMLKKESDLRLVLGTPQKDTLSNPIPYLEG